MARDIGDKVGPRLAQLVAQYVLAARRDLAPHEARVQQVATQALIDKAGHEFADHIGPLLHAAIAANPDMPEVVKGYLTRTASGKHQLQAVAGHIAMMGANSVLSQVLSNFLAPGAYALIATQPHLRLDQGVMATLAAQRIVTPQQAYAESAEQGYDSVRAQWLIDAALAYPDSATVGQLINRQLISPDLAQYLLEHGGYPDTLIQPLLDLAIEPLAPADAALAVLRTEMTQDAGAAKAALSGVTADDFGTLVANTGEPLGLESLMEALRREFIDETRFARGVAQSRVRNEWLDVALKLRYEPMSTADAVNAVVQNFMTADQAAAVAQQNGLEAGDVNILIETAGEPLSRTELEQLYNRGLIDVGTVQQGLRESRLKDKYIDDAVELHVKLPPAFQVVAGVRYGAITPEQAAQILVQDGYTADTAALLIATGLAEKTGATKDLTVAEIKTLYTDAIMDAPTATQYLSLLGYDASEAAYLIETWNFTAQAAVIRQAVDAIRTRYVSRKLSWDATQQDLAELGVPEAAIANFRSVWTIEQSARVATLSEAQIVAAVKENLMAPDTARNRLMALGYSDDDAHILLKVAPGTPLSTQIGGTGGTVTAS
jgi:SOS response regulatory protein OraA/RecX